EVRAYYGREVKATRFLDRDALRRALAAPPIREVTDGAGERLTVEPATRISIVVGFPDELLISLSRDKFPVEEDARHEAARLGVPLGPAREARDAFVYPAWFGREPRDAFIEKL